MTGNAQRVFCICCKQHISRKREREHRRQAHKPPTTPTPHKRPRLAFKAARTPHDKAKPASPSGPLQSQETPTLCKCPRLAFKAACTPRDKARPTSPSGPLECQDIPVTDHGLDMLSAPSLDIEIPIPLMPDSETGHHMEDSGQGGSADSSESLLATCLSQRWNQGHIEHHLQLDCDKNFDEHDMDIEDGSKLAPDIPFEDGPDYPDNDELDALGSDELSQEGGPTLRDELRESFEAKYSRIGALYYLWCL